MVEVSQKEGRRKGYEDASQAEGTDFWRRYKLDRIT